MDKNGNKTGGKVKGSVNKRTKELIELAEELDCNPFEILLHFAKGDYEALGYPETKTITTKDGSTFEEVTISPELRQRSAKDACEYLYPKRRAIEHSVDDTTAISIEEFIMSKNKESK